MNIVECRGVHKDFGSGTMRVSVIQDLNMRVSENERVAVVGVSGSGKSTLLHLIGALERADQGLISVCGKRLDDINAKAVYRLRNRQIGIIYQFHHLLPEFTVYENVLLPLLIGGSKNEADEATVVAILQRVGLGEKLRSKPHELSGGERQRVAVCRALITRPQLILADEPTGNLDQETAQSVIEMMLAMYEDSAMIIATHDESLAAMLDRRFRLEHGRLTEY